MTPLISRPVDTFGATIRVPGDKSISHRALILSALAAGTSRITGLLEAEDVLNTAAALRALGVSIERTAPDDWAVHGVGIGGLREADGVIDLGNSGTGVRLLMGVAAGHPIASFFTGDESLRRRPMARVIEPLRQMGAVIHARAGGLLPLLVEGTATPMPIVHRSRVSSAQVKSAILLAGLSAPGATTVIEPWPSRDHTENMLRLFGAEVDTASQEAGHAVTVVGQPELAPQALAVPGDPSSAAFPTVAAAVRPGSRLRVTNVGVNPLRTGFYTCLAEMGAAVDFTNPRTDGGEAVADIEITGAALRGIEVPPSRAATMIDDYPALCIAAAFASGQTVMRGAGELRVKESDRIHAMAQGLGAAGVKVTELDDGLIIDGTGEPPKGGSRLAAFMDHRVAMAFLVLGLGARGAVGVDDASSIETSFPGFVELMNGAGADIGADTGD